MDKFSMLLVSVPASDNVQQDPFGGVKRQIGAPAAAVHPFRIPELRVGTLDSLMILDEELAKVDVMAEQSILKIMRQYSELSDEDGSADGTTKLLVKGTKPAEYLEQFSWDEARFSHNRRLSELVKMIQQSVGKIDDDMKTLGQDFSETKQHLSTLQRKRGANLMVADLKDVLSKDACLQSSGQSPEEIFKETAFLQPVAVVVPVSAEEQFLNTYERLCDGVVTLKTNGAKFSPVVPGSHMEVMRDNDGYVLYRVYLLKGVAERTQKEIEEEEAEALAKSKADEEAAAAAVAEGEAGEGEPEGGAKKEAPAAIAKPKRARDFLSLFTEACRISRFIVKPYHQDEDVDEDEEEGDDQSLDQQIAQVKADRDRQMQYLKRRCTPYFEDVYVAWIHIKAIRVFVESVLRYGVPPKFHSALIIPTQAKFMRKVRTVLEKAYSDLDTMNASKLAVSEDVQRVLGATNNATYLPYISISINFLEM